MKRDSNWIVPAYVLMLLVILLITPCCKKSPEKKAPSQTQQQKADSNEGQKVKTEIAAELEPINIELPKPMLGKPRPPFLAPAGTKNVALGKPVVSSDKEPIIGEIEMITDGDKEAADGSYVELSPSLQQVTIDLGVEYDVYAILLWHYHKEARVYFDVVVQVADDPDFTANVKTLFNNDLDNSSGLGLGSDMHYVETAEGKLIDARGVRARYVRLYSNGNSSNELNHYIEVEVFGTTTSGKPTI
jgi:hypothetical protein